MILLQAEISGFFDAVMQQGILFGFMLVVIIVLARRIIKLEAKIDGMVSDKFEETKDITIMMKDATEAMQKVSETRCAYEKD